MTSTSPARPSSAPPWTPPYPAYEIQQACGTGLQAVIAAAGRIALGQRESAIAGGSDTASDAPRGVNDSLRQVLWEARRVKSLGACLKILAKVRPGHLVPDIPRNAEPRTGLSMGERAAVTARTWGFPKLSTSFEQGIPLSREAREAREARDDLAATSHQRLAAAYERDFRKDAGHLTPSMKLRREAFLRDFTEEVEGCTRAHEPSAAAWSGEWPAERPACGVRAMRNA